jgi:hypothetical protein
MFYNVSSILVFCIGSIKAVMSRLIDNGLQYSMSGGKFTYSLSEATGQIFIDTPDPYSYTISVRKP